MYTDNTDTLKPGEIDFELLRKRDKTEADQNLLNLNIEAYCYFRLTNKSCDNTDKCFDMLKFLFHYEFCHIFLTVHQQFISNNFVIHNIKSLNYALFSEKTLSLVALQFPKNLVSLFQIQKQTASSFWSPAALRPHPCPPAVLPLYNEYLLDFFTHFNPSNFEALPQQSIKMFSISIIDAMAELHTVGHYERWIDLFSFIQPEHSSIFISMAKKKNPAFIEKISSELAKLPHLCATSFKVGFLPILKHCNIQKLISEHPDLFIL